MTAPTPCFHCASDCPDPIEFTIRYREHDQPACCAGCKAVADTILASGLASYYDQRTESASRTEPLPAEIREQLQLYDDFQLQSSFVQQVSDNIREAALILEGISCAACIWLNEQHLSKLPGVLSVSINYSTHRARVRWDDQQVKLSSILQHIAAIGYRAHPYDHERNEAQWEKQRKSALLRLWVAGLSMMQVMMFVIPIYMAPTGEIEDNWLTMMHWGSALLTLPVVLYSCWPFYVNSWRELRHGRAGMDLPVSIGVVAAFIASLYSLITAHGEIYFDSVSMFVFLLLGGRYLELQARRRAGAAAEMLVKLVPAFAHRLSHDHSLHETPVHRLKAGDLIVSKAGETIPVDGVVLDGRSEVNEAMLSGESRPIIKESGSSVVAGSLNLISALTIEVKSTGNNTRLGSMVRLLDQSLQEKPYLAQLADRVAGWFIFALLLIASACFLYWYRHDPIHALPHTVAVLVISCPCALSLATPAALTAATGHLAQIGLLLTRGNSLENLARVTDIVFDKTGTLTFGEPRLSQTIALAMFADEALPIAIALENRSEHPIAKAFQMDGKSNELIVTDFCNYPGGGIYGKINGEDYWLGSSNFISKTLGHQEFERTKAHESEGTIIYLADKNSMLAAFVLADQIRPEAKAVIDYLKTQHYQLHLLSGDQLPIANLVGEQLGIQNIRAAATPETKVAYIKALQAKGHRVLMLGDGVNDAPVLAMANVSIAMGEGVDIAQAAGDMILLNSQLETLPKALLLAKKCRKIIRQNLIWALAYNLAALPIAVAGLVTPWLASLGMALSSLLVVLNALRLLAPDQLKKAK
ncbi:heavy metal translocating P-type ATPase [Chitinibacter bivalviorum]|uniref:Heavy metal translocating P-type ATPase n=1 Tax=Chitinibacter bivalviorum TaxID=2739434 RepID=A0A7H9BIP4_9NEIS|nr:heavy metal translocating P-type ATPase [Chitinibacter bivalviorum]QLG87851.1 heavy metal translocating P-type ATPase [Chitinibacter bivalviorum]